MYLYLQIYTFPWYSLSENLIGLQNFPHSLSWTKEFQITKNMDLEVYFYPTCQKSWCEIFIIPVYIPDCWKCVSLYMFYTINHSSSQEGMLAKRHDLQKMAAFNLGVAEAVTHKKKTRDLDFHVRCFKLVKKKKKSRLSSKSINSSLIEHVKILRLFFFLPEILYFPKASSHSPTNLEAARVRNRSVWTGNGLVPELSFLPHTKTMFRRLLTQCNTCTWCINMIM